VFSEGVMGEVDQRGKLEAMPFGYRQMKDGRVFLDYEGKMVKTLKGKRAERFIAQVEGLDDAESQLYMAKATGNFKRGNEREGKHRLK